MDRVVLVEITDDNRQDFATMTFTLSLGEKCKYCLHEFTTLEDLREREVIFAGYHEHGKLACKICFERRN